MFSEGSLEWMKEEVEKLCLGLTEQEWREIEPDWGEPYGDADVNEVVGRVIQLRGGTTSKRRRRRRSNESAMEEDISLPPRMRWLHIRPTLEKWRREYGFASPIRLAELR